MNLLELCTSPNKGGLELYFADISNALSEYFNMVNVVGTTSQVAASIKGDHLILQLYKKVHYLPLVAAWKLAKIFDQHQINVVHLHWNKDLTMAIFAKLFSRSKPKIVLMRHMQMPSKKDGFFHRFLYRNLNHIIAITETMAADLKRFIPADVVPEISVNYLGVEPIQLASAEDVLNTRKPYDPTERLFLIGLFGRIEPYKGHDFLIDALILAKATDRPFKALIVGRAMEEDYLKALQSRIKDHQLEDYVVFTGFVDRPRTLMQACDTVILTTVEETFGLVLIEAMSVGVPVIGSDRGGVPEIIDDKQSGLLFKSENSESLYEALDDLYQHPEMAKQYATAAAQTAKNKFSSHEHLTRMITQLNHLAKGSDAKGSESSE